MHECVQVMIKERASATDADIQVARTQVSPETTSHLFTNLKPNTRYIIGIVAFVDNHPRYVYKVI